MWPNLFQNCWCFSSLISSLFWRCQLRIRVNSNDQPCYIIRNSKMDWGRQKFNFLVTMWNCIFFYQKQVLFLLLQKWQNRGFLGTPKKRSFLDAQKDQNHVAGILSIGWFSFTCWSISGFSWYPADAVDQIFKYLLTFSSALVQV